MKSDIEALLDEHDALNESRDELTRQLDDAHLLLRAIALYGHNARACQLTRSIVHAVGELTLKIRKIMPPADRYKNELETLTKGRP